MPTLSRQQLIAQHMRDQTKLEGLGAQRAQLIGTRISLRLSANAKRGADPMAGTDALWSELQDLLTWSMVSADLTGRVRTLATSVGKPERFALDRMPPASHRTAIDFTRKRLNLTRGQVDKLASTWGREAADVIKSIKAAGNKTVRDAIAEAVRRELGTRQALKFINAAVARAGYSPVNPHRLETAYRTSTNMAYNAGRWEQWQDPDIADLLWGFEYATVGDDRVRPDHEALDGTRLPKGDPRWNRLWPPNGWNSVPSWTRVLTARGWRAIASVRHGDLVATHRGRMMPVIERHLHEGPAELVTVSVNVPGVGPLWVTANHRVFTHRGWVDAGSLEVGDKIAHPSGVFGDISGRHVKDGWDAERFADRVVPFCDRLRLVPLNFDTAVKLREQEVEPVRRGVHVVRPSNHMLVENGGEEFFACTESGFSIGMGFGVGGVLFTRRVGHLAAHRRPSCGGGDSQFIGGRFGSLGIEAMRDGTGRGGVVKRHASRLHNPDDGSVFDTGGGGQLTDDRVASLIGGDESVESAGPMGVDLGFGAELVGQRSAGLLSHATIVAMSWATVTEVGRVHWGRRMVCNLAVAEDDSYIAEGIAVHNCRCSTIEILSGDREARTKQPRKVREDGATRAAKPDDGFAFNPGKLFSSKVKA